MKIPGGRWRDRVWNLNTKKGKDDQVNFQEYLKDDTSYL
jgi:hypothetical protein